MTIKWRAPEYSYFEKDISWYWLVVIVAIIVVAVSLWQRNFLFAVFTILAALILIIWGYKKPAMVEFELNERGLEINSGFYSKDRFKEFAIRKENEDYDKLMLIGKSRFSRYLVLPVPKSKLDEIKKCCLNFWAETEYKESLIDELANFIRF